MEDFIKYPKIKVLGDEENKDLLSNPDDYIIIQEKIDSITMGESSFACWDVCYGHYDENWTYRGQTEYEYYKDNFNLCLEKYHELRNK